MTYKAMLKKSRTNPELMEELKQRLGSNLQRIIRLSELHREGKKTVG